MCLTLPNPFHYYCRVWELGQDRFAVLSLDLGQIWLSLLVAVVSSIKIFRKNFQIKNDEVKSESEKYYFCGLGNMLDTGQPGWKKKDKFNILIGICTYLCQIYGYITEMLFKFVFPPPRASRNFCHFFWDDITAGIWKTTITRYRKMCGWVGMHYD